MSFQFRVNSQRLQPVPGMLCQRVVAEGGPLVAQSTIGVNDVPESAKWFVSRERIQQARLQPGLANRGGEIFHHAKPLMRSERLDAAVAPCQTSTKTFSNFFCIVEVVMQGEDFAGLGVQEVLHLQTQGIAEAFQR